MVCLIASYLIGVGVVLLLFPAKGFKVKYVFVAFLWPLVLVCVIILTLLRMFFGKRGKYVDAMRTGADGTKHNLLEEP